MGLFQENGHCVSFELKPGYSERYLLAFEKLLQSWKWKRILREVVTSNEILGRIRKL